MKSDIEDAFDNIQLILITIAMIFHTDGINGQFSAAKNVIEDTQLKYLTMLHRYLKDKFQGCKAEAKFADGVMILNEAKEAHDIHKRRLPI